MMKRNITKFNWWKQFVDGIYTRSDIHSLSGQLSAPVPDDFEEVSKKVWEESEMMSEFSLKDLIANQRIAIKLLDLQEESKRRRRIGLIKKWASVAAVLLVCFSSYYLFRLYSEKELSNALCEINVPYGMKLNGTLPDGTKIILNAGSILKYPRRFDSDTRRIEFTGEGFFDVAKNENLPFVITSKGYNVKVLGTTFNLNNYEDNDLLSLTLCTGKVQMSYEDEQISLRPGEQLLLNKKSNDLERTQVDTQKSSSWIYGKFHFNKTPFREAIRTIERYYNCQILLDPQCEFANKLSGTHDNQSLESVLQSVEMATGIKHREQNGIYILYK